MGGEGGGRLTMRSCGRVRLCGAGEADEPKPCRGATTRKVSAGRRWVGEWAGRQLGCRARAGPPLSTPPPPRSPPPPPCPPPALCPQPAGRELHELHSDSDTDQMVSSGRLAAAARCSRLLSVRAPSPLPSPLPRRPPSSPPPSLTPAAPPGARLTTPLTHWPCLSLSPSPPLPQATASASPPRGGLVPFPPHPPPHPTPPPGPSLHPPPALPSRHPSASRGT